MTEHPPRRGKSDLHILDWPTVLLDKNRIARGSRPPLCHLAAILHIDDGHAGIGGVRGVGRQHCGVPDCVSHNGSTRRQTACSRCTTRVGESAGIFAKSRGIFRTRTACVASGCANTLRQDCRALPHVGGSGEADTNQKETNDAGSDARQMMRSFSKQPPSNATFSAIAGPVVQLFVLLSAEPNILPHCRTMGWTLRRPVRRPLYRQGFRRSAEFL